MGSRTLTALTVVATMASTAMSHSVPDAAPALLEDPPSCCPAMTAECLACEGGITIQELCQDEPWTDGCEEYLESHQPHEPLRPSSLEENSEEETATGRRRSRRKFKKMSATKRTGPIQKAAAPIQKAAAPIQKAAAPIQKAAGPIQMAAATIQKAAAMIQKAAATIQEAATTIPAAAKAKQNSPVNKKTGSDRNARQQKFKAKIKEANSNALKEAPLFQAATGASPLKAVKEVRPLKAVKEVRPLKAVKEVRPLEAVKEVRPLKAVKEVRPLKAVKEAFTEAGGPVNDFVAGLIEELKLEGEDVDAEALENGFLGYIQNKFPGTGMNAIIEMILKTVMNILGELD